MTTTRKTSGCFVGLMSGTSTDGIDGVIADIGPDHVRVLATASQPLPTDLRSELLALNTPGGTDELARSARAANRLSDGYAQVVHTLLHRSGRPAEAVCAIGAHGQTVRHAPQEGYSVQLNAPARLAEHTGIAVIADFRSRDIAAGGQGAPLVPAFHAARFGRSPHRAILNLGGIANLTVLGAPILGFDTGPANLLLDAWAQRHLGRPFDDGGQWAAQGRYHPALLERCLDDPWFKRKPPRSTGRDHFNSSWLDQQLQTLAPDQRPAPVDTQATLLRLTVRTIADALANHAPAVHEVLACGGGALNATLMEALSEALHPVRLTTTADHGVPVMTVEALAFAWLAWAHLAGQPASLRSVTGARHDTLAGAWYPA